MQTQAKDGVTHLQVDGVPVVQWESPFLKVQVAPSVGGRIISLVHKATGQEVLWRNRGLRLQRLPPDSEYDPNFFGGIDELLPNDIPETINGVPCPDHGELWTTALETAQDKSECVLSGKLSRFGLRYERRMSLNPAAASMQLKYRLSNASDAPRTFLWKLHAALNIQAGDQILCPAQTAQVVDPAWSRYKTLSPFHWPMIEGQPAHVIPAADGTMDFFYLYDLTQGEVALESYKRGLRFVYRFERKVFPYVWLFASYGGFNGHYTVILEPCTAMPMAVNEAAALKQCTRLEPGQVLETVVTISLESTAK